MVAVIGLVLYLLLVGVIAVFGYSMNRIQYVERLRIYWIFRNNAGRGTPFFAPLAFMHQDTEPFWYGTGAQFRLLKWTLQVGTLEGKHDSLLEALGGEELEATPSEIRKWS